MEVVGNLAAAGWVCGGGAKEGAMGDGGNFQFEHLEGPTLYQVSNRRQAMNETPELITKLNS